jgi:hypothetical protein
LPRLLALNGTQVEGYVDAETGNDPTYLKGLLSGTTTEPNNVAWKQPSMVRCIAGIRKAYPNDAIGSPVNAPSTAPATWTAPEVACRNVALLAAILEAAGKYVNNATFTKGGESLRNLSIPGVAGPISFERGQQYADAPIFLVTYDALTKTAVTSSTPTGT